MRRATYLLTLLALVAACGEGDPDPRGAQVERFTVDSRFVDRELEQIGIERRERAIGRAPGLLVLLHGRTDGDDGPDSMVSDALFTGLRELGNDAPAVLLVNGGGSSYFHDRDSGDWASYVMREAIPEGVRRLHVDPRRIAIGGISMGGFGALHLAGQEPFCAVGGHSPALWLEAGQTPEGAFDDAEDFAASTPFGRELATERVWLDVGSEDPFRAAVSEFGRRSGHRVRVREGGHEGSYWDAHMGEYLRFYAQALADCG